MAASAAVAATSVGALAKPSSVDVLGGVLDYSSLGSAAAAAAGSLPPTGTASAAVAGTVTVTAKSGMGSGIGSSSSSSSSGFDMGRHPISTHSNSNNTNIWGGYGGRLQFFKGKFKIYFPGFR